MTVRLINLPPFKTLYRQTAYGHTVRKTILSLLLLLSLAGCKERFDPPPITAASNYLVVEGFINTGQGPTQFYLSRTVKLADSVVSRPELNAQVIVEGDNNTSYPLFANGNGSYAADQLFLDNMAKYRLHIITNGKEYVSDFVTVKQTPAIDSISWKKETTGVRIYANTHDPQNATQYYKWDYDETWEIHSPFPSYLRYVNGDVVPDFMQKTKICWKYGQSHSIIVGSSARLQNDVIHEAPLLLIPNSDERISVRYSILVRQYAIDKKAYSFYEVMRKNTESLGSIFDAQPSELRGNIRNTSDPDEMVIGYVSASNVTAKRIFIANNQLSNWVYDMLCETTLVPNNKDSFRYFYPYQLLPYAEKLVGRAVVGYYSALPHCVDCTLRGSNVMPSYW